MDENIVIPNDILSERRQQIAVKRLLKGLDDLYGQASEIGHEFASLAELDMLAAIRQLPQFIQKARDINPDRAFVEAIAGGPNQDWIVPMFNVVGELYPELERNVREEFLRQCLDYLDERNYVQAQDHVVLMHEPLLIIDILFNRSYYWPGVAAEKGLLKSYKTAEDIAKQPPEKLNTFWMCLAVVWNGEWVTLPVRQWYYKQYPDMLDCALDYAAMRVHVLSTKSSETDGVDSSQGVDMYLEKCFESSLHDRIRARVDEVKDKCILI